MTMFACYDFDNFAFLAVDKQVSMRKTASNITPAGTIVKLIEHNDFFITGCGLQVIIEPVSHDYLVYKDNSDLYTLLKSKYPKELVETTKVVIVPKHPVQNVRIMFIDFSKDTFSKALRQINGTMQGSKYITVNHREQFEGSANILLSANAEQSINKGDFQVFIDSVSSIFSSLATLTSEVSAEFDYVFIFDDGRSYLNELPE
tara:strand:- start:107 stop:715 length:609 start_codon:yes stop_codon:yes gene_type:complete